MAGARTIYHGRRKWRLPELGTEAYPMSTEVLVGTLPLPASLDNPYNPNYNTVALAGELREFEYDWGYGGDRPLALAFDLLAHELRHALERELGSQSAFELLRNLTRPFVEDKIAHLPRRLEPPSDYFSENRRTGGELLFLGEWHLSSEEIRNWVRETAPGVNL